MSRPAPVCDNKAVGALITDRSGRYLVFSRVTYPAGYAPVEGHVDDRRSFQAAIAAAVSPAIRSGRHPPGRGLELERLAGQRLLPASRAQAGIGHEWRVCRAEVAGNLQPGPGIQEVRLVTGRQLQQLANRTALYARGRLSDADFTGRPGLEAVWVRILHEMGLVVMTDRDLTLTGQLAARPAPAGATS